MATIISAPTVVRKQGSFCKRQSCFFVKLICSSRMWSKQLFAIEFFYRVDWLFILRRVIHRKAIKAKVEPCLSANGHLLVWKKIFAGIIEEVEALIKKRVKEGSGKEYDHIVRKELVAYKGKAAHESDFQEFTKYEASRAYKAVSDYMEAADDPSTALAKEIEALELQISTNEAKVTEMATQEATSEAMVVQAEAQIKEAGDTFVKVVEALKILEDLKDMLTEKSAEINEIAS